MKGAIRLGSVASAPVIADGSVFVLLIGFASAVFVKLRTVEPAFSTDGAGIAAAVAGVGIVLSVFLHEYGHVVVASRRGLTVQEIRLSMFGGYSAIVGEPTPKTELLVSIAGPLVTMSLAIVGGVVSVVAGTETLLGATAWALTIGNGAIFVVNLMPGFPLDGGNALRALLASRGMSRHRSIEIVTTVGRALGTVATVIGVAFLATGRLVGLFWVVAGWFLASTARTAGTREALRVAFDGLTVSDLMRETNDAVPGKSTITDLLSLYGMGASLRSLPVEMTGRVVGVIGQKEIDTISPNRWPSTRVSAIMTRIGPADVVESDAPVDSLLFRPAGLSSRAIVIRDGVTVGIIEGKDLQRLLA